ncbi:MAG: hypothetical protein SV760_07225, partial [Halobacteria archaeon]|nr:hypothetical protein [Halobacteria archaeon]
FTQWGLMMAAALLMVVALTNLGSIIGTALFLTVVLPAVSADANVDMTRLLSRGLENSWETVVNSVSGIL